MALQLDSIESLRKRAKEIFSTQSSNDYSGYSKHDKEELIAEIVLSHIEMKLQKETLSRAQQDLEEVNLKLESLCDLAPLGYFFINHEGLITGVNQTGASLLGVVKSSLINKMLSRYITPEYQEIYKDFLYNIIAKNKCDSCDVRMLNKNGPIFYARLERKDLSGMGPESRQLALVITDITGVSDAPKELQGNQRPLVHFGRALSLNDLAVIITQQFSHPYAVITNYIHGCIRLIESGRYQINDILHGMKQAVKQLQYISEIIMRLKNFSYKNICKEEVCINSLIKSSIELMEEETKDFPVKIYYRAIPYVTVLKIDKIHVQQVILHLIRNAIDSMRDGEIIEPCIIIEGTALSREYVEISITDNGPGFSQAVSHRLFEPQFTTKSYGIGMGLTISRSIIEFHGGSLNAELNKESGACFKFTLDCQG